MATQIEEVPFTTPSLVIFPSNLFAVLPQVVRGEPSLVVTPYLPFPLLIPKCSMWRYLLKWDPKRSLRILMMS